MISLSGLADGVSRWIDMVAEVLVTSVGRLRPARPVQLIEGDDDVFAIRIHGPYAKSDTAVLPIRLPLAGAPDALPADLAAMLRGREVELVLRPHQFLFRPLDLPKRAAEFLEGIVRAQIDRLTPWSAGDAAFGWTPPAAVGDERICLTVVATARARIARYVDVLSAFGPASIVISALPQEAAAGAAPIRVFEQGTRGLLDVARVRRALLAVLAVASLAAGVATVAGEIVSGQLEAQERDLARRIAERRVALFGGGASAAGAVPAQQALERRKRGSAASVMVLEALSRILPDHTYLTELRVEGDRLQIIGITQEAPELIRLMERSPHFTRATFFAPTTRSSGDPGERFHIEAHVEPVFGADL